MHKKPSGSALPNGAQGLKVHLKHARWTFSWITFTSVERPDTRDILLDCEERSI
jgi:hypothetical protein